MADADGNIRHSRFWLYAPFVMLALVAIAWTVAWTVIRGRVVDGADRWLAAEAQAGRQWTCQDRQVGGYPFRIEVNCASLTLRSDGVSGSLGRVHSVAQVYQPGHIITEIEGPMRLTDGRVNVEGTWRLLETSVRGSSRGFQRASVLAEGAQIQVTGAVPEPLALSSERIEAHLRPNPSRAAERAFDAAVKASRAKIPFVDTLVGGGEPSDVQLDVTATEAEGFRGRPALEEVERWRQANGKLDILQFSVAKGPRRLQATGDLRLDDLRRPAGQLSVAATGLEGLIGSLTGNRLGGNLLGALLGQAPRPQGPPAGSNGLSALPPFRFEEGRVLFGPFAVPNLRLAPLY